MEERLVNELLPVAFPDGSPLIPLILLPMLNVLTMDCHRRSSLSTAETLKQHH